MGKDRYKITFNIDGISLKRQQEIFKEIISKLDFNERQSFHVTVTDSLGGQHNRWDNTGVDPDGNICKKCGMVDCCYCDVYEARTIKNGKNDSNSGVN